MSSSQPNYGSTSQPPAAAPPKPAKPTEGGPSTTKIEPKVWFANERTWLNWSRTGVLLGTFGVAIVNASNGTAAKALGVVYAAIAVATIWYGWLVYQKRIKMIRDRYPGHFDELVVPVMIGMALFIAIILNFAFRIVDRERSRGADGPKNPWVAAPARFAGLAGVQSP